MRTSQSPYLAILLALAPALASGAPRAFPEFAQPHLYGRVVLDNYSSRAGIAPVAFDHTRHRMLYTCRVCHVDVGFVMEARVTEISAESNRRGFHCGACHDGKHLHGGAPIFAACSDARATPLQPECVRCHVVESDAQVRRRFDALARSLPRDRSGLVDWEQLERLLLDKPIDFVEGASVRRDRLKNDRNFSISAIGTWLGDVTFSHQKHAAWSGCEGCHPEVFPSTRRGAVAFQMKDITAGKYCGACHNKVAFPIAACLQCHATAFGPAATRR